MERDAVHELVTAVCEAARELVAKGLVLGRGGNVSARDKATVYISPRGAALDQLTPEQLVPVRETDGRPLAGGRPSSELPMHLACYRARPEAQVVIHCHPPHTIALSTVGETIPALTPDFLVYMGVFRLPVVAYHTPGTEALASAVEQAMRAAPVAVLANHGLIAVGETPERALARVLLAEETARIYLLARALGRPRVLGEAEWRALQMAGYRLQPAMRPSPSHEEPTARESCPGEKT